MSTGRYRITDLNGKTLRVVEPISERNQQVNDKAWTPGGADFVDGGAVRRDESIITEANGFTNIREECSSGNEPAALRPAPDTEPEP